MLVKKNQLHTLIFFFDDTVPLSLAVGFLYKPIEIARLGELSWRTTAIGEGFWQIAVPIGLDATDCL